MTYTTTEIIITIILSIISGMLIHYALTIPKTTKLKEKNLQLEKQNNLIKKNLKNIQSWKDFYKTQFKEMHNELKTIKEQMRYDGYLIDHTDLHTNYTGEPNDND